MKKIVYAIALLGALPLFQSCIDDSESLSVKEVREAKAEQLQSMADLNKANADAQLKIAEAEVEARKAEAQLSLANAELVKAQAALVAVQAQLEQVNVQIAQTQLEEEKVELEKKKVELEIEKSNYDRIVAENQLAIQKAKNKLELLAKQLELSMQNLANELLAAQIENLKKQKEYDDAVRDKEIADATATQRKLNKYLLNFQEASKNLYEKQADVFWFEQSYKEAQADLLSEEEEYEKAVAGAIKHKNNKLAKLAAYEAELKAWQQFSDVSLAELEALLAQANADLIVAKQNLLNYQKDEESAFDALAAANENMDLSYYYLDGVEVFLNNGIYPLGGPNYDEETEISTTYYGFQHYVVTEESVSENYNKGYWESDTLFVSSGKLIIVESDPAPVVPGVETQYGFNESYTQIIDSYAVYDADAVDEFIAYMKENNQEVTEEQIQSAEYELAYWQVRLQDAENAYYGAKQVFEDDAAIYLPMEEKAQELWEAAWISLNDPYLQEYAQLIEAQKLYEDRVFEAQANIDALTDVTIPDFENQIEDLNGEIEKYEKQLENTEDPYTKEVLNALINDIKENQIAKIEEKIDAAKAEIKEWETIYNTANTQLKAADDALQAYVKDHPEVEDEYEDSPAWQEYNAYTNTVTFKNAMNNYNTSKAKAQAYEPFYFFCYNEVDYYTEQLADLNERVKEPNYYEETLTAAYKTMADEAANYKALVAVVNEASVALVDAQLVKYNGEAVQSAAQDYYDTLWDLANDYTEVIPEYSIDPETGELVVTGYETVDHQSVAKAINDLEKKIEKCNEKIAEYDSIINEPFDPSALNNWMALLEAQLNDAKAELAMYQAIYDQAKANLEKAYEESGLNSDDTTTTPEN